MYTNKPNVRRASDDEKKKCVKGCEALGAPEVVAKGQRAEELTEGSESRKNANGRAEDGL